MKFINPPCSSYAEGPEEPDPKDDPEIRTPAHPDEPNDPPVGGGGGAS